VRRSALLSLAGLLSAACAQSQRTADAGKACAEAPAGAHSSKELAAMARVIEAGLRTSMLAGDGLTVRDFIENLEHTGSGVEVSLFTTAGERVYGEKPPPPDRSALAPHVRQVIEAGKAIRSEGGLQALPLANEAACRKCHPAGALRGVLTLSYTTPPKQGDQALPLGSVVAAAFDAMMTAGKASDVDRYLQALPGEVPGIAAAAVFSRDGRATLGDGLFEVPEEVARRALNPIAPFVADVHDGRLVAVPLPNRPRCLACHKPSDMRGAIILKLTPALPGEQAAQDLMVASVRHVMLTGLGRLAKKFLDQAGRSGLFARLTLHDPEGRLFHDMHARPTPPAFVAEAIRTGRGGVTTGNDGRSLFFAPVRNEDKCRRCHDEEGPLRAIVAVQNARPRGARASAAPSQAQRWTEQLGALGSQR
jgi:hypothetical protein